MKKRLTCIQSALVLNSSFQNYKEERNKFNDTIRKNKYLQKMHHSKEYNINNNNIKYIKRD